MRNLRSILVLATSLLPFAAQAAPADLPESGQIFCYNAAGTAIACAGTGQDGDHTAGVAWPSPRFVVGADAETACVTDKLTGLMWVRAPSTVPVTWANALTSANNLVLCGYGDWRLPNLNELESLVNLAAADQVAYLNAEGFTVVQTPSYWSSTSFTGNPTAAWLVYMLDGLVFVAQKGDSAHVWPVRAGR